MQDACPATPIVVLTSTDDEDLALRLLRSGAQDYLVKSEVTSRWIIRALRNAVGRSSAIQSRRKQEPELDREFGMEIEQIGDVTVLRVQETQLFGDRLLEQLSSQMFKLVDEGGNRKLVLNCDRVEHVSNSVLTRLVMWDEKIRQHGGSLRVCNLRRDIQDQIKARRLLSQLNICIDEETALRFF
jgi:anti-anti-sigma regulatory factor